MMDFIEGLYTLLVYLVPIAAFLIWYALKQSNSDSGNAYDIPGEQIWLDEGKQTKPFFDQRYQILGKPDAMFRSGDQVTAVEYKSRRGRVQPSDIVQAKTAALCARANGYRVTQVLVVTATERKTVTLPSKDAALYQEIAHHIENIRALRKGASGQPSPEPRKCASCAYRNDCSARAA